MKNERRVALLIALPIIIFLWIIGWSLYWTSYTKQKPTIQPKEIIQEVIIIEQEGEF